MEKFAFRPSENFLALKIMILTRTGNINTCYCYHVIQTPGTVSLTIHPPTEVLSVSESQVLTEGESTALICSVSHPAGLPSSALISWTKDGVSQSGECCCCGDFEDLIVTLILVVNLKVTMSFQKKWPLDRSSLCQNQVSCYAHIWWLRVSLVKLISN